MLSAYSLMLILKSFAPDDDSAYEIERNYVSMVMRGVSENEMQWAAIECLKDGVENNNWPWAPTN